MTDIQTDIQTNQRKLNQLAKGTHTVVYRCKGMFPFTIFPDEIILDENKVDIIHNHFFFSKSITSIYLSDIRTVTVNRGPLWATMVFEIVGYETNPEKVTYLPIQAASRMRDAITGMALAKKEQVNMDALPEEEVAVKARQIGKAS